MTTAKLPSAPGATYSAERAPRRKEQKDFRFYDNRQKYLMFVTTCSEKLIIGERIARELDRITPRPPALRFFDAGTGDGTVLSRALRSMHQRFGSVPFYVAGKEISLEDARLTLEKMPDRFLEHPETVIALTNISYADAPWLRPSNPEAAKRMRWMELALDGQTSAEFEQQILDLQPFLSENWKTHAGPSGALVPETPATLVIYRKDRRFVLHDVIPQRDRPVANYDLVLASQPFRLRAPTAFKARRVLAPLARALGPDGRLLGIHSAGGDPGLEIVQQVWPGEDPFVASRHDLLEATREALGEEAEGFAFEPLTDEESLFRYRMHTMPDEIDSEASSIGTSTLLAAWNAATYVAQIEDDRLSHAMSSSDYLQATRAVLSKHGELWFNDESYVIARKEERPQKG